MHESPIETRTEVFVTALGWVLVVFTGFGAVGMLMQNVMVWFVLPALTAQIPEPGAIDTIGLWIFRIFAGLMLGLSLFFLYAAWSFIKRHNWARRTIVVMFWLSAIWSGLTFVMFGLAVGVFNISSFPAVPESLAFADPIFRAMGIMFGALAAAMLALCVWVIRRLGSPEVRAQFQAPASRADKV